MAFAIHPDIGTKLGRRLLWPVLALLLVLANVSAFAVTTNEANRIIGAYNSAFYEVSGTNGYFKDTQTGGVAYFWGQAEMIECVIDAYEWTTNPVYGSMITNLLNGFLRYNGANWSGNMYNDDIMWAVIAFARGGKLTGKLNYCQIAKSNFDTCFARSWDSKLGGGLYWTTDNNTKNACVNGPGSIAASLLYEIYGDVNYLNKAKSVYDWERSVLFNAGTGAIYDAIETNGVVHTWSSTYNQGTFIGAANFLGYTNDAALAANYTMLRLTTGGILPEYGIAGNNSGFNAIFLRWMNRFIRQRGLQDTYRPWLRLNAESAFNIRRTSDGLSWCQWLQPTPLGTNFYAWDCISSFEIMHAAEANRSGAELSYPPDVAGYWALDSTAGTVAVDSTINTNHGTVSAAAWNSNGRFNGCLDFDGTNSVVRMNNKLGSDFSISFWVKTTQTSSSGQWYNGKGLIDADAPYNNNDFGTALVGGRFAFGIGNPDITIVSARAINDGVWHHCVATRQRATGAIRVYVDGELQGSSIANRNTLRAAGQLAVGAFAPGGGNFSGSIDDIRFFARTLTSGEVAALYNINLVPPLAAPTDVKAVPGKSQVELAWGEAPLATSYRISRALQSGGPYTLIGTTAGTTYKDSTVQNNRTYYYVITAVNPVGNSANSSEVSANPSPLVVWLKADTLAGAIDGAPIATWPDMSGRNWHASQMISSNCPTYAATAINGMPAVRFNPANKSYLWMYRPVQDDFTTILVFRSTQGSGNGSDFYSGAGLLDGECSGGVNDFGISFNVYGQILAGTGNPDRTVRSSTGLNNGLPHIVTFKRTKSSGAISLYIDGTLVATGFGGTQTLNAPNQLMLGAQQTLDNFFNGDVAEVQIYNSVLTETERLAYEKTLKCKYGLAGGGTPSSPTGLAASVGSRDVYLTWLHAPGATGYDLWRSTDTGITYQPIATGLINSSYTDLNVTRGFTNMYKIASVNSCGTGTFSAPLYVNLPLPALGMNVAAEGKTFSMSWPVWASGWALYGATNLTPPVFWSQVTNAVGTNAGQMEISVPTGSGLQFFRLVSP